MKRLMLFLVIFIPLVSCMKSPQSSSVRIGLVNFVMGNAFLIGENNLRVPAQAGMPVDKGMKIATAGPQSVCEIYFNDNAVKIQGDSLLDIDSLSFRDGKSENTALIVEKGKVFTHVSKLGKNDIFSVKTSTCVAAVRGTGFSVSRTKTGSKVSCLDGKVEVSGTGAQAGAVVVTREEEALSDGSSVQKKTISSSALDQLKSDSSIAPVSEQNRITFEEIAAGDASAIERIMKMLRFFHDPAAPAKTGAPSAAVSALIREAAEPAEVLPEISSAALEMKAEIPAALPEAEHPAAVKKVPAEVLSEVVAALPEKKAKIRSTQDPVSNIRPQNRAAAGGQMVPPVDINPEYLQ